MKKVKELGNQISREKSKQVVGGHNSLPAESYWCIIEGVCHCNDGLVPVPVPIECDGYTVYHSEFFCSGNLGPNPPGCFTT